MGKIQTLSKSLWNIAQKHGSEILITMGTGGLITAVGLGIYATIKAVKTVEEEFDDTEKPTTKEIAKATWKYYIPTGVTMIVSTGCIIFASRENNKRNMALATAYTLSETAMSEYKEKVIDTIGKKKEKDIQDSIAADKVKDNPASPNQVVITEKGDTLCYDTLSGRYFKSNIDKVKQSFVSLNYDIVRDMYASVNDLYYLLGLECVSRFDDLGWNVNKGVVEPNYSYIPTENGEPCLVIDYSVEPRYDYQY